jgi:hypothetical protein
LLLLFMEAVGVCGTSLSSGLGLDAISHGKQDLERVDLNKDGKADLAEITAYIRQEFYGKSLGANGEEILPENANDMSEARKAELAISDSQEYLNELDSNKDGFLDLDELTTQYNTHGEIRGVQHTVEHPDGVDTTDEHHELWKAEIEKEHDADPNGDHHSVPVYDASGKTYIGHSAPAAFLSENQEEQEHHEEEMHSEEHEELMSAVENEAEDEFGSSTAVGKIPLFSEDGDSHIGHIDASDAGHDDEYHPIDDDHPIYEESEEGDGEDVAEEEHDEL